MLRTIDHFGLLHMYSKRNAFAAYSEITNILQSKERHGLSMNKSSKNKHFWALIFCALFFIFQKTISRISWCALTFIVKCQKIVLWLHFSTSQIRAAICPITSTSVWLVLKSSRYRLYNIELSKKSFLSVELNKLNEGPSLTSVVLFATFHSNDWNIFVSSA